MQAMNAATDVEDVSGQLAALLGLPGWSPRAVGTLDVGVVSTDVEVLWATAQRRRPSLVALRQQQAAARGGLFLARRERLPVPALSGGTQTTRDVNGTSAFVGFSMPLPLFDHNQGAVAKATAQIDAADLSLQAGLGEARAEIERAATVLKKRREALQRVRGRGHASGVPTLRRMAEDAYREGQRRHSRAARRQPIAQGFPAGARAAARSRQARRRNRHRRGRPGRGRTGP